MSHETVLVFIWMVKYQTRICLLILAMHRVLSTYLHKILSIHFTDAHAWV